MAPLFYEDYDCILNEAAAIDEAIGEHFVEFQTEADYDTLAHFFDKTNYQHYDVLAEEFVAPDTQKILKKILRGKDTISLIQFALDLGRLIGRAEYTISNTD